MPRQARLDVAGALHHIMVRGSNQSAIFGANQDGALFLERLGEKVTEERPSVYAWALMDTHAHILFRSAQGEHFEHRTGSCPLERRGKGIGLNRNAI